MAVPSGAILVQFGGSIMATLKYRIDRKRWQVRWQVTVRHGKNAGDVISGSQSFRKKAPAQDFLKIIQGKEELWAAGMNTTSHPIKPAVERWKLENNKQYTPATRKLYEYAVDKLTDSLPKQVVNVEHIKPVHIKNHLAGLDMMAFSTRNRQLDGIRSFTRWASETFEIENTGLKIKKFIEDPPDTRFLTEDEYAAIMKYAKGDTYDYLLFIANTGLRATEFCNVKWEHISKDLTSLQTLGKGRKKRSVPLNTTCQEILKRYKKERKPKASDYIFLSKSRGQLSRFGLRDRCVYIAEKLKIPNFGPHAFRHYFATTLILKGVRMKLVSEILGHSSVRITEETYTHILPDHLAGITEVLDSLEENEDQTEPS